MRRSLQVLLPAAGLLFGLAMTPAHAAPAGANLGVVKSMPAADSAVKNAYWVRKCHHNRWGRVRCHRVWVAPRWRQWNRWGHRYDRHRHSDRGHSYRRYR